MEQANDVGKPQNPQISRQRRSPGSRPHDGPPQGPNLFCRPVLVALYHKEVQSISTAPIEIKFTHRHRSTVREQYAFPSGQQ